MNTKLKGDIGEQTALLFALKRGWGVSKPVGDRLPYDLIFDINNSLYRIQVKCAWYDEKSGNYLCDNRRTKTNRKEMKRDFYQKNDFDFCLVYIEDKDVFYILPIEDFLAFSGVFHLVEEVGRQRVATSRKFRNAWHLLEPEKISENFVEKLEA